MNKTLLSVLNNSNLISIASLLAVNGSMLMLTGGVWDAASHALKEPEYFWSIQHVTVYSGVGMIASSAVVGSIMLVQKKNLQGRLPLGLKIIIVGAILQIASGYGDSLSHDVYGIDGLISLTHQTLEAGLVLSALGSYLVLRQSPSFVRHFIPFSILVLLLSISWLVFNLVLLVGGPVLCILVYHIFSSGCAIL